MDFELLPVEVYENLPPFIKKLTDQFEDREKDVVFISALGVISSLLPKVYGIYDRKKVYPNIYTMVLAPPASGKGVMNYCRKLAEKIDDKVISESKKKIKDAEGKKPGLRVKIIPGNISSSDMYDKIKNAHHGGLIFESEADTINTIMKQDFGDFSDVLRKAFHHENLSISRKTERQFDRISSPRLSVVLSGTPDQLKPFVKSTSNGLFSRVLYYFFNEINAWKNVFDNGEINLEDLFDTSGVQLFELYEYLMNNEFDLKFSFTEIQESEFNEQMAMVYHEIVCDKDLGFIANVKRQGLILYRIGMILTTLRQIDNIKNIDSLLCSDEDFKIIKTLIKPFIHQAYSVFNLYNEPQLSNKDSILYKSLPKVFQTSELLNLGHQHGFSARTCKNRLKEWVVEKIIVKIYHGQYRKNY